MAATVLAAFLSPLRCARCANRRRWTAANLILAFALALPVIFLHRPSLAADAKPAGWTVVQAAGDARYRLSDMPGTPWLSVKAGTFVALQAQFETGTDGRVVLTREGDRITMSPNSRIVLPDAKPASTVTRVFQSFGIMLYKVRSRAGNVPVGGKHPRRFEVQTPYLVSTVKGTTFSISVTGNGSAVNLIEGILQVSTPDDAVSTQILGGQIASVAANAGNAISVIKIDGTGHKVHHGPPKVEAKRSGETLDKTANTSRNRGRGKRAVISSIASHRVRTLTAGRIASRSGHGSKGRRSRRVVFVRTAETEVRGRDHDRANAAGDNKGSGSVGSINTDLNSNSGSGSLSSINTDLAARDEVEVESIENELEPIENELEPIENELEPIKIEVEPIEIEVNLVENEVEPIENEVKLVEVK